MVGMNFADRAEAQSFSAAIESKVDQNKKTSESLWVPCVLYGSLCSVWVPCVLCGSPVFCVGPLCSVWVPCVL